LLDSLGSVLETLNSSYYILNPRNTTWKNSIYLRDRAFLDIRSGVEVTGVFYTGEVPVEVQMAAANLIGLFFSSSRNIGEFKKESIEGYSYEVLTGAEKTLQQQAVFEQIDQWRKVRV
jgi:hypothetical protein